METSNPTLNSKIFSDAKVAGGTNTMTVQGTVNKTMIMFAILVATAIWTWSNAHSPIAGLAGMAGMFIGLILALAGSFKPTWTPVTAPLYAACEGLALGYISAIFEVRYPGIVTQAVGLTFAVMFAMLMGYKAGWLQATPALRKGLMIGMMGLLGFYAVVWIASMFGIHPPGFINGGGPLGIAFSLVIIGMASMSLVLDFDFIENAASQGLAKYMEWYGAFSLMVTLVWLYVEILRLLSKMNSRN